jgi:hypothetical protein
MARSSLSLPHERRKATLQAQRLRLRVRLAETKEGLKQVTDQLRAMSPKPTTKV